MLFLLGVVSLVRWRAFTCLTMLVAAVSCIWDVTINGLDLCTAIGLFCCDIVTGGASLLKITIVGPLVSKDTLGHGASTIGDGIGTVGTGISILGAWSVCSWHGDGTYAGGTRALPGKNAACKHWIACLCAPLFVLHSPFMAWTRSCNALTIVLAGVMVG